VDQLAQPAQTEKEDLILARGLGVKDVCGVCFKKTYANHEGTYCHRLGIVSKGLCHDCGQNKAQIRVQITVT